MAYIMYPSICLQEIQMVLLCFQQLPEKFKNTSNHNRDELVVVPQKPES